MKKYIAVTTDGQIVGERATKKDIQFVAQQQAKQLQEVIQVKQYDPWTASYIPIRRETMKTLRDRQAETMERQQSTNYSKGIIAGHHVSRRQASYLSTHTRCTKGHGWTIKGESGGCAKCEREES